MAAKFGVLLRVHVLKGFILNFVKRLLGVKQCTQNDFVYGELGCMNCQYVR